MPATPLPAPSKKIRFLTEDAPVGSPKALLAAASISGLPAPDEVNVWMRRAPLASQSTRIIRMLLFPLERNDSETIFQFMRRPISVIASRSPLAGTAGEAVEE